MVVERDATCFRATAFGVSVGRTSTGFRVVLKVLSLRTAIVLLLRPERCPPLIADILLTTVSLNPMPAGESRCRDDINRPDAPPRAPQPAAPRPRVCW